MSFEVSFNGAGHRWWIDREVGRGGQCSVFQGGDRQTGKLTAIKVMHPRADPTENAEMRSLFKGSTARLGYVRSHPNLVELYGSGEHNYHGWGHLFMATEFVPDGSLERRMQELQRPLMRLGETVSCIGQIACGMAVAHGLRPGDIQLVHRDLKPANILISHQEPFPGLPGMPEQHGQGGVFKVADFDASILGQSLESAITKAQIPIGTLPYMPPEQAAGRAVFASDVYALGVIAYKLLTGRFPVAIDTRGLTDPQMAANWYQAHIHQPIPAIEDVRPRPFMNEVVEAVQIPIHTALSKRTRDRQPNMAAFYDDFAAAFRRGLAAYHKRHG